MKTAYPRMPVLVAQSLQDDLVSALQNGQPDIVICRLIPDAGPGIEQHVLFDDRHKVVAAYKNPLTREGTGHG